MAKNLANKSLEDQFLRWRQDMETKQKEQARQMAELRDRADCLQQENDRLRDRLEEDRGGGGGLCAREQPSCTFGQRE